MRESYRYNYILGLRISICLISGTFGCNTAHILNYFDVCYCFEIDIHTDITCRSTRLLMGRVCGVRVRAKPGEENMREAD